MNKANPALSAKHKKFEKLAEKFRRCTAKQQYKSAIIHARNALKIMPNHYIVLSDLAFCLLRDKQYLAAYTQYKRIFHAGETAWSEAGKTWLDGLAEVCGWLGKEQELQRYGCLSLRLADQKVCEHSTLDFTPRQPRLTFDARQQSRNVISFSLFGDQPKYCESAVLNAQIASRLFAQWSCRFYVAEDVPAHVCTRLEQLGAQIVHMDSRETSIHPLLWRFLVVDDSNVDFYLIRDADSLLSEKEQAAVAAWTQSSFWFHHMRDYFTHTELLLAGMWAGTRGALPALKPLMQTFCLNHRESKHFIDQHFLREQLWPLIRNSVLCHDDIFKFHQAQPFPDYAAHRWQEFEFHIGSNCSYQELMLVAANNVDQQQWVLVDEQDREVCRYQSPVIKNKIVLSLPFVYVAHINAKQWRIQLI